MQNPPQIILRDPAELRLHPLQKHIPDPVKDSPEWVSFIEGWQNGGLAAMLGCPIIITTEGLIMDGGRRWRAARQLGWPEMPCIVMAEHEAASFIVDSVLGQRNLPRGTKVYLVLSLIPDFVTSSERRRMENLKRGKMGQNPLFVPKPSDWASGKEKDSIKALCQRLGVGREAYRLAVNVRQLFEQYPEYKAALEPKLLSGEKSLWNVASYIGGATADQTPRDPAKERSQLELFGNSFETLGKAAKSWGRFAPQSQAMVLQSARNLAATLPPDLRAALADIFSTPNH